MLSAHIVFSVGWLGVVLCGTVLAVVAASTDEVILQAARISVAILDRMLVRYLAFGTLATGILVSLLSQWGLLRFRWVIVKQILTLLATNHNLIT